MVCLAFSENHFQVNHFQVHPWQGILNKNNKKYKFQMLYFISGFGLINRARQGKYIDPLQSFHSIYPKIKRSPPWEGIPTPSPSVVSYIYPITSEEYHSPPSNLWIHRAVLYQWRHEQGVAIIMCIDGIKRKGYP